MAAGGHEGHLFFKSSARCVICGRFFFLRSLYTQVKKTTCWEIIFHSRTVATRNAAGGRLFCLADLATVQLLKDRRS